MRTYKEQNGCDKEKLLGELYYLGDYNTILCSECIKELQVGSVIVTGSVRGVLQDKIDGIDGY